MKIAKSEFRVDLHGPEDIPLDVFLKVMNAMSEVAEEVDKSLGDGQKQVRWLITSLKHSSSQIGASPHPLSEDMRYADVASRVQVLTAGIREIQFGEERPDWATDRALRGLKRAYEAVPSEVQFKVGEPRRLFQVDANLAAKCEKWLGATYVSKGSVQGHLDIISAHEKLAFTIFNRKDQRISCTASEEFIDLIRDNLKKLVLVRGRIRYQSNGVPISVSVEDIIPMPSNQREVKTSDVTGAWGKKETAERFLRRLHGV
jgi:hypothetical protein